MGAIKREEIVGFWVGEWVICTNCIKDEEESDITIEETILDNELDGETLFFCDRCKKQLPTDSIDIEELNKEKIKEGLSKLVKNKKKNK